MSTISPQVVFVGRLAFVRADTRGAIFGALGAMRFAPYAQYSNPAGDPIAGYLTPYNTQNPTLACQKWPGLPVCDKPPSGQTAAAMLQAMVGAGYVAMMQASTPPGRSTEFAFTRNPQTVDRMCNPARKTSGMAIFDGPEAIIQQAQAIAAGVPAATPPASVPAAPPMPSCPPGMYGAPPACVQIPTPPQAQAGGCPPGTAGISPFCSAIPGQQAPPGIPAMPSGWPTIPGWPSPVQAGFPGVPGFPGGAVPGVPGNAPWGGGCPPTQVGLPPNCYPMPKAPGAQAMVDSTGASTEGAQEPSAPLASATGGSQQSAAAAAAGESVTPSWLIPAVVIGGATIVLLVLFRQVNQ